MLASINSDELLVIAKAQSQAGFQSSSHSSQYQYSMPSAFRLAGSVIDKTGC